VGVAAAALTGCGQTNGSQSQERKAETRPGSAVVYQRIEAMTDCAALQKQFDIADRNTKRMQDSGQEASVPISYMEAADARMQELTCYG
jgi:hypothetical protein